MVRINKNSACLPDNVSVYTISQSGLNFLFFRLLTLFFCYFYPYSFSQAERWFKPCVNGDFSFLWVIQKFDPHRIKTPDPIEIKFGTVDYVGEGTRHANFYANSSKGASRQMGEIYAKIFIYICLFFLDSPTGQTF